MIHIERGRKHKLARQTSAELLEHNTKWSLKVPLKLTVTLYYISFLNKGFWYQKTKHVAGIVAKALSLIRLPHYRLY